MSREAILWAKQQRTGSPTRKAVLNALAWRHHEDTGWCSPQISQIVEETELGDKTVRRALEELCGLGFIHRTRSRRSDGTLGTYEYRFPPLDIATAGPPVRATGSPPVAATAQVLSSSSTKENLAAAPQNGRARNEIWDALTTMFGEPTTRNNQKLRGQICSELKAAGATSDEILARGKRWPQHFDSATLTETALVKHWDRLGRKPLRAGR